MMTRRHLRTALPAILAAAATLMSVIPVAAVEPQAAAPAERTTETIEPTALVSGQLTVIRVTGGLSSPLGVTHADDGSGRLFVVERGGRVRVVKGGAVTGTFLNISSRITAGGERGLLGLAFHPNFASNRRLFVYYTRTDGDIIVSRLTANSAKTAVSLTTEVPLLRIEHSARSNHNGGGLAFGPDGFLYIAVGDGGGSNDPDNNGQDRNVLLGKILRIDVNNPGPSSHPNYAIPDDNPFVGKTGADQIWAWGMRNPWRIAFDRANGNLFIADVGQDRYEEINRQLSTFAGGANYGWDVMEGKHCRVSGCTPPANDVLPVAEYTHSLGCSITGGYVYRGSHRDLQGLYVFGDFCSGRIWTMGNGGSTITVRKDTSLNISSFGESESGELFVTDLNGVLYRVIAPEFRDIATSTFLDSIHWILYEGLTVGCGSGRFCPTAAVTREQMAIFLVRAFDHPSTSTDYFTDDEGRSGESSINALRAAGITSGCGSPTLYCPTRRVTRAEMAIFLDKELNPPATSTDFFDDDDGKTGESSINRLAAAGITGGCGTRRYCPTSSVTRGQMAAFLKRALEYAP
ncbi:MAG: Glucose/sorbosone dehydrogenase-like protein [Chloroflexota bacterium]|nr:Glucose/sorbosone dehydrogenase-like protein [Chloroflexota bacterium]